MSNCKKYPCIGNLDKRLTLLTRSMDSTGLDLDENFTDIITVWGNITTAGNSSDFFDGVNLVKSYTHLIKIRYRSNLTSENWIRHNSELYRIIDIKNDDEDSNFLIIKAMKKGVESIIVNRS